MEVDGWVAGAVAGAARGADLRAADRRRTRGEWASASGQAARLEVVSRRRKKSAKKAKPAPVVSRAQMELAQEMVRERLRAGARAGDEATGGADDAAAVHDASRGDGGREETVGRGAVWAGAAAAAERCGERWIARGNAAMATAAARLALYDADRALELLDSLPSQGGSQADARTMAARLVFAGYMQHHGRGSGRRPCWRMGGDGASTEVFRMERARRRWRGCVRMRRRRRISSGRCWGL